MRRFALRLPATTILFALTAFCRPAAAADPVVDSIQAAMQQFVDNLEAEVSGKKSSSVSTSTSAPTTGSVAATAAAERGASDLGVRAVDTSGPAVPGPVAPVADAEVSPPVVTKVLAAAGALVAVVAFGYLLKRRRAGRGR